MKIKALLLLSAFVVTGVIVLLMAFNFISLRRVQNKVEDLPNSSVFGLTGISNISENLLASSLLV